MGSTVASKPEQVLDALASPLRSELMLLIEALGETVVADLAAAVGRPADRLYHHMHKLEAAGLIRAVGTRSAPRRDQTVYAIVPETANMVAAAEHAPQIEKMAQALFRNALRHFIDTVAAGALHQDKGRRNGTFRAELGWLSRQQRRDVLQHIDAIRAIFADSRQSPDRGEKSLAVMLLTPVQPPTPKPS